MPSSRTQLPPHAAFDGARSVTVANPAELLATHPWNAGQQLAVQFLPSPGVQLELALARGDDNPALTAPQVASAGSTRTANS
jgi:hypothetical protein